MGAPEDRDTGMSVPQTLEDGTWPCAYGQACIFSADVHVPYYIESLHPVSLSML